MKAENQWIVRKARVARRCTGWQMAASCGRDIQPGEQFAQSTFRAGLERAELCIDCDNKRAANPKD